MSQVPTARARARWLRFLPILFVAGIASFVVGTRVSVTRPSPLTHPLTGRAIPGIATDANWLDRPERQRQEAPDRALQLIGVMPGMTVADIGAGTGYLTTRIAGLLGPTGKVYANDVQPGMLRLIERKVRERHLANVEVVQGSEDDTQLPPSAIDLAVLVDVYHELRRPQAMLQSIRRSLRSNGELVLVEYREEDQNVQVASTHTMSVAVARAEIEAEGFMLDRVIDELPRQHVIIFRKAEP